MDQIIHPQHNFTPKSPSEARLALQLKNTALILGILSLSIVILSLIALFMLWNKNSAVKSITDTINTKNQAIETNFSQVIERQNLVKKQIAALAENEQKQINFSDALWNELSKRAIKKVRLVSLDLAEGKVSIDGTAENFSDIARQIASWRQSSNFKNVSLSTAAADTDGLKKFSAAFEFKPKKSNK